MLAERRGRHVDCVIAAIATSSDVTVLPVALGWKQEFQTLDAATEVADDVEEYKRRPVDDA
jgi:hypothetical protein